MEEPIIVLQTVDSATGATVGWDSYGNMYYYDPKTLNGLGSLGKWQPFKDIKKAVDKIGDTKVGAVLKTVVTPVRVVGSAAQNIAKGQKVGTAITNSLKQTATDFKKAGDVVGEGVRFINRFINPATILIRNGWLVAMKVDMFNVAKVLRWAYTDYATARAKTGMSQDQHNKIKNTAHDIEIIYWQAGGERSNLKKAILNGKGNHNQEVPRDNTPVIVANDQEELRLLQADADTLQGLGALGIEPTSASLAAVSTAVAGVAAKLKPILDAISKGKQVVADVRNTVSSFAPPKTATNQASPNQPSYQPAYSVTPAPYPYPAVSPAPVQNLIQPQSQNLNTAVPPAPPQEKQWYASPALAIGAGAVVLTSAVAFVIAHQSEAKPEISGLLASSKVRRRGRRPRRRKLAG